MVREVWPSNTADWYKLDIIEGLPYGYPNTSYNWTIEEYIFRDNAFNPTFGELNYFHQRYTGLFVPPLDSYYTFNVISDDMSRLYLSPNSSREHKERVAYVSPHTSSWTRYASQMSTPMYLNAGER